MILTAEEILLILGKIHPHFGYSSDPKVAALQGKLSVMLEVASRAEEKVLRSRETTR